MLVPVFVCGGVDVCALARRCLFACDMPCLPAVVADVCMFPVCVSLTVYALYVCVICFNLECEADFTELSRC